MVRAGDLAQPQRRPRVTLEVNLLNVALGFLIGTVLFRVGEALIRKAVARRQSWLTVDTRFKLDDPDGADCEHHWVDVTAPGDSVDGVIVRTYVCGRCNIRRGTGKVAYHFRSDATTSELVDEVINALKKRDLQ